TLPVHDIDVAVIGAGVVGLACAAALATRGRQVAILEKNRRIGQETTSRNSGVIHAGLYYPTGSLKARLCVEGRHFLYEPSPRPGRRPRPSEEERSAAPRRPPSERRSKPPAPWAWRTAPARSSPSTGTRWRGSSRGCARSRGSCRPRPASSTRTRSATATAAR